MFVVDEKFRSSKQQQLTLVLLDPQRLLMSTAPTQTPFQDFPPPSYVAARRSTSERRRTTATARRSSETAACKSRACPRRKAASHRRKLDGAPRRRLPFASLPGSHRPLGRSPDRPGAFLRGLSGSARSKNVKGLGLAE